MKSVIVGAGRSIRSVAGLRVHNKKNVQQNAAESEIGMERLTIKTCDGDICYEVKKDPEGAYDILDLAKYIDDGDGEEAGILLDISNRLAAYEDSGLAPEEVKNLIAEIEYLRGLIGKPPAESHPDEWKPRGRTWHEERQNWADEVKRLQYHIKTH